MMALDDLRRARDLTADMLDAARRDDWTVVGTLERERAPLLERSVGERGANTGSDRPPSDPALFTELRELDAALLALASAERDRAADGLRAARGVGRANRAYRAAALGAGTVGR